MRQRKATMVVSFSIVIVLFAGLSTVLPVAEAGGRAGQTVRWKEIIGTTSGGVNIGGIVSFAAWTARNGRASVNLDDGKVTFVVRALVLAGSTPLAVAGTTGLTTHVKGTLVCNGLRNLESQSVLVDTDSVTLDPQGNARFSGNVTVPPECANSEFLAFLIRVAEAENPFLLDKAIGVGVVRTP